MSNLTMKEIFDEYNKAEAVPTKGFSKEQLKVHKKAQAFMRIVELAEANVKQEAKKIFDKLDINFNISSCDNSKNEQGFVNAMHFDLNEAKNELNVGINFNFSRLCNLPPEEAYSLVYSSMYMPILNAKEGKLKSNEVRFDKEDNLSEEPAVNDAGVDRDGHYAPTTSIIVKYLKKLLKLIFEDDFSSGKSVAGFDFDNCARKNEQDFKSGGITAETMFENPHGLNLFAERYGKIVKQGNDKQATQLLGVFSKSEFASLKSGNMQQIRSFCEKYAKTVLEQSGIDANLVPITFEPRGAMGEYMDYGNRQSVNINMNEVVAMQNPAEVVMILQHELTHAIDSTKNKSEGNVTREGYGLTENLVGGLDGIEKDVHAKDNKDRGVVQDYYIRLNEMCYRLNPNERSARQGELTAIMFMKDMQNDDSMKTYIDKSIESYNRYQRLVVEDAKNIPGIENEYVSKIQVLIEKGGITDKLIIERLNYLKSLDLAKFNEQQAIEEAKKIQQDIEQSQIGE